jgi:membrane protease YdiL (CAAX protease family)
MKYLFKYPYLNVLLIQISILFILFISGMISYLLNLPDIMVYIISLVFLTIFCGYLLIKNVNWRNFCFARFKISYMMLIIVPSITIAVNLFGDYDILSINNYFKFLMLTLMVGFVEEGFYRGIMLNILLPKGLWKASIITSLLFALSHSMNAFNGWDLNIVLMQISYSFAIGFGWAAFAIKCKTVWPLMIVHFLTDFLSFIKSANSLADIKSGVLNMETVTVTVIMSLILVIYGYLTIKSEKFFSLSSGVLN